MRIGHFLNAYRSGGTDKILLNKIVNWPNKKDQHIIFCNSEFNKLNLIKKNLRGKAKFIIYRSSIFSKLNHNRSYNLIGFSYAAIYYILICYVIMPFEIIYLSKYLNNLKLDAIFIHNGGWPAARITRSAFFAAKIVNIKKIFIIIHSIAQRKSFFYGLQETIIEFLLKFLNVNILTVSKEAKSKILKNTFLSVPKIIYNGVIVKKVSKQKKVKLKKQLNLCKKNFIISTIGTVDHNRGQEVLIRCLANLKKNIPNIILLIIGSGRNIEINKIKRLVKHYNLQKNVKLLGFRDDVEDIISISDLIVNPVKKIESFGLVSIEAMSQKKPIISSKIGAVQEVIINNKSGILVRPEDPDALSKKILLLFQNKSLRMSLGKNGFNRYNNLFTINKMCRKYYKLLT